MQPSTTNPASYGTSVTAFLLLFVLISPPVCASESIDEVCNAGGYYSGAEDRFLSGLASYILAKKGIVKNAKCSALWAYAYDVGAYFSKNGKVKNQGDEEMVTKASEFASHVYDSVLENMELK